jgi:CDP-diacylglycerol--glycerol-3-phosphate 3-phosphatidyltransferase
MFRHVPNLLTGLRLFLALVFFVMLAYYQYEGRGDPWLLQAAFFTYLVALITDFLDGFLARRWNVEGQFGRIVDPFADKVLVLGSFIFFAGKNFIIPETAHPQPSMVVKTLTGVAPGIVVILLARELLVTTFRGMSESAGKNFGAQFSGKLKMVFQSVTILVILAYVTYYPKFQANVDFHWYATAFRDLCIWATVAVTVVSGLLYMQRVIATYRDNAQTPSAGAA